MQISLDRLCPGKSARVTELSVHEKLKQRLRAFGVIPGALVQCCYRCPGGKVTALACMDGVLAIRTAELKNIRGICL